MSIDVARLPTRRLAAGTALYRIHRARHGPWFFADSVHQRFNPTGTPGRGACYWAEDPLGAWVESFRTVMTLTHGDVDQRALSRIALDEDRIVADLTVRRALAAGVTAAITGGANYAPAQALADQLQGRAEGIRYRVRHDLAAELIGVALFGQGGPATGKTLTSLPKSTTTDIPDDLIDRAGREFGYLVLPPPI